MDVVKITVSTQLSASACKALGNVFRSGALPLPTGVSGRGKGEESRVEGEGLSKAMLVECLDKVVKNAKQPKVL